MNITYDAMLTVKDIPLVGKVTAKATDLLKSSGSVTFTGGGGIKKDFRFNDIQFLIIKKPNKDEFNIFYNGEIYTTDVSNYSSFKEKWDKVHRVR